MEKIWHALRFMSVSRETTGDTCEIGLSPSLMLFHLSEDLTSFCMEAGFELLMCFSLLFPARRSDGPHHGSLTNMLVLKIFFFLENLLLANYWEAATSDIYRGVIEGRTRKISKIVLNSIVKFQIDLWKESMVARLSGRRVSACSQKLIIKCLADISTVVSYL